MKLGHSHAMRPAGRDGRRRDANEADIVKALRRVGAVVELLSMHGAPDLLVGFRGVTYLLEVKTESGHLNKAQTDWARDWGGGCVHVVRTPIEALLAVGALAVAGA